MNDTLVVKNEKDILQEKINSKLSNAELSVKPVLDKIDYENTNNRKFVI